MMYDKEYLKIRSEWRKNNPQKPEDDFFEEVYGIPKHDPNKRLQATWSADIEKCLIESGLWREFCDKYDKSVKDTSKNEEVKSKRKWPFTIINKIIKLFCYRS